MLDYGPYGGALGGSFGFWPMVIGGFFLYAAYYGCDQSQMQRTLSAASVEDLYVRYVNRQASDRQYLLWSRAATVAWGVLCTGFAFLVGNLAPTVIEGIKIIGSVFYGPILAAFLLAILSRRVTGRGVLAGLAVGVGMNLLLWWHFSSEISWLWWNVTGCVAAMGVAYFFGIILVSYGLWYLPAMFSVG